MKSQDILIKDALRHADERIKALRQTSPVTMTTTTRPGTSLADKLHEVSKTRDPKLAGKIVEFLRLHRRASYLKCQQLFATYGINADDFENLMQEADNLDSEG